MKLVVTVDVEEDQWGIVAPGSATVHNVGRLPILQNLFNGFGIIPTYFLTYPVVSDPHVVTFLRDIMEKGGCEIGAHCHPWNSPPFEESLTKRNSMLCNLSPTLQFDKLRRLHEAIETKFEMNPIAFRSGRWGFDAEVARNIFRLGYRIDTSVTPYTSWAQESGPDFSNVSPHTYALTQESLHDGNTTGTLTEIPVTIGYLHGEFQACATLVHRLRVGPFRRLRLGGLLSRLDVLRKVWLSPEMETPARMIQLVRQMRSQGYEILNLVFHSSALMAGCGPFVRTARDEQFFLKRLVTFLQWAREEGVVFLPLSDAASLCSGGPAELESTRASPCTMDTCPAGDMSLI